MNETTNNIPDLSRGYVIKVVPEKTDPVEVVRIRRQGENLMAFFGQVRSAGNRPHTGYDYEAPVGTPVKAVQSGEIIQLRFGRPKGAINEYYERSKENKNIYYEKKEKFYCPHYIELIKKKIETGTINEIVFDTAICTDCQNRFYYKYSIVKTNKENKEGQSCEIITTTRKKIKGKEQLEETAKTISVKKGEMKEIDWYNYRCGKICFGVQVWLRTINAILSKKNALPLFDFETSLHLYYAYYAHLNSLSQTILTEIDAKLNKVKEKADELKEKKREKGITKITFEELFAELKKEKNVLDTTISFSSSPLKINIGETVGGSGCTGNAYDMENGDQHLHFECRTQIEVEPGKIIQISPNSIVKTQFYIYSKSDKSFKTSKVTDSVISEFKKKYWSTYINQLKSGLFQDERKKSEWREIEKKTPKEEAGKKREEFEKYIWPKTKKEKWKNFSFLNEKYLEEKEKNIWIAFKKKEYEEYQKEIWKHFEKEHYIKQEPQETNIISLF